MWAQWRKLLEREKKAVQPTEDAIAAILVEFPYSKSRKSKDKNNTNKDGAPF
jgi:hypothetical protein